MSFMRLNGKSKIAVAAVLTSLLLGACSPGNQLNTPMSPSEEFKKAMFVEPKKELKPVPEPTPVSGSKSSGSYDVYEISDVTFAPDAKVASLSARATIKSSVGKETVDMVGVIRDDGSASLMDLTPLSNGQHRLVGEAFCVDRKECKHIILNVFYNVAGKVRKRQFVTGELLAASDSQLKHADTDPTQAHESEKSEPNAEDQLPTLAPFKGPDTNEQLVDQLVPRGETPELDPEDSPETAIAPADPRATPSTPTAESESAMDDEVPGVVQTPTPTPAPTARPSATPTTVRPTATPKATAKPTATPAADEDDPPDESKIVPPTPVPTATPKATVRPTATPKATAKPAATATARPTAKPAPKATPAPTMTQRIGNRLRGIRDWVLSPFARATPAPRPRSTPAPRATARPAARPTSTATPRPTARPTARPAATATPRPTAAPARRPPVARATATPAPRPTARPAATATPRPAATAAPTPRATARPGPAVPPAVARPSSSLPVPPAAPTTSTDAETAALMIREAQLAPLLNVREGGIALRAPTEGGLRNASQLPQEGEGFKSVLVTSGVKFGSGILISFLQNAAAYLKRQLFPDLVIGVGDIAKERGGQYGSHQTHDNGLAADIGWIGFTRPLVDSAFGADGKVKKDFPFEKTWKFIELAYKQRIVYERREQSALNLVYMSPAIKNAFCDWAKEKNMLDSEDNKQILRSILRQNNHYKHFHVGFKCSPHYPATCRHFNDPAPGTGCR